MFLGWDGPVMPDSGLLLTMLSHGLVAFTIEFDSIGLAGMARPTSKGQKAQCLYRELTHEIKERWPDACTDAPGIVGECCRRTRADQSGFFAAWSLIPWVASISAQSRGSPMFSDGVHREFFRRQLRGDGKRPEGMVACFRGEGHYERSPRVGGA